MNAITPKLPESLPLSLDAEQALLGTAPGEVDDRSIEEVQPDDPRAVKPWVSIGEVASKIVERLKKST